MPWFFSRCNRVKLYSPGTISISDRQIAESARFQNLSEEDLGVVSAYRDLILPSLDGVIQHFYQHIASLPQAQAVISRHTTVERQRGPVTAWISSWFQGRIDDAYVANRVRVGQIHDRVDVPCSWFLGMCELMRADLVEILEKSKISLQERERFNESLMRLIAFDQAIVLDNLLRSRQKNFETSKQEVKRSTQEDVRLAVEVKSTMAQVADGNIGIRMEGSFSGELGFKRRSMAP